MSAIVSDAGMKPSASTVSAKHVRRLVPIVIVVAVVVAFWPVLRAEFVNWDDDANFLNNVHFRGLSWRNLGWMLTTFHMSNYQPLSWMTFALGYSLWGMHPAGYHATSVALHALNAVLVYATRPSATSRRPWSCGRTTRRQRPCSASPSHSGR